MSYKTCYAQPIKDSNNYRIHLWDDEGYKTLTWNYYAYEECDDIDADQNIRGLRHESLRKVTKWSRDNERLHFHDIKPYQRFLIDKYGTDDEPSTSHKEIFFDIEIEMGGALTEDYIRSAPKPVTSIAWWYKQKDEWVILILDQKGELEETIEGNRKIIPLNNEQELLMKFLEMIRTINPDILVGYNSDYFDIPYLYYRMCNIFDSEIAGMLSPIGWVRDESQWNDHRWLDIAGLESLDYMKLHKKFSFKDEPSYKLDYLGKKYANLEKIEYEGSLDRLFKEDKQKFIEYNFRDVEILKALDEKFQYLPLTKNLAHKGKIRYSDVYKNSLIHDGAISAYLLSQGIIPPARDRNPITKKNYAGGYLFCPQAGLYKYMFDEDLTSLYPSIIMSLNIGKETLVGRVLIPDEKVVVEGKEIFNNRYSLNDLKAMDPDRILNVQNSRRKLAQMKVKEVIELIESSNLSISANGVMYRTDFDSVLKTILAKWFEERVIYKNKMKTAYKSGNKADGEKFHLMQHTMKILLNSLYGATALGSFRYGNVILSESITLTGQRIIQESALFANTHMNKVLKGEIQL
jgi:DNA polymerase elongation subunit (family B)